MSQFLKDLYTEDDGIHYCLAKVTSTVVIIGFFALEFKSGTIPPDFGAQLMDVMIGCGALIFGKQISQKKDD